MAVRAAPYQKLLTLLRIRIDPLIETSARGSVRWRLLAQPHTRSQNRRPVLFLYADDIFVFSLFCLFPLFLKLDFRLRFSFSGFSWGGLSLPMWCVFARTQNIKGGPGSEAMVASSGVAKVFIASQPQNRERTS